MCFVKVLNNSSDFTSKRHGAMHNKIRKKKGKKEGDDKYQFKKKL